MPFQPKQHSIDGDVLQAHFHLPMAHVAKKFDVCLTFFKKICRQHGIKRWPYRKLKSLEKKITSLTDRVEGKVEANLTKLNDQLTELRGLKLCENLLVDDDDEAHFEQHEQVEEEAEEVEASRPGSHSGAAVDAGPFEAISALALLAASANASAALRAERASGGTDERSPPVSYADSSATINAVSEDEGASVRPIKRELPKESEEEVQSPEGPEFKRQRFIAAANTASVKAEEGSNNDVNRMSIDALLRGVRH